VARGPWALGIFLCASWRPAQPLGAAAAQGLLRVWRPPGLGPGLPVATRRRGVIPGQRPWRAKLARPVAGGLRLGAPLPSAQTGDGTLLGPAGRHGARRVHAPLCSARASSARSSSTRTCSPRGTSAGGFRCKMIL
jgi:hypothetical protein